MVRLTSGAAGAAGAAALAGAVAGRGGGGGGGSGGSPAKHAAGSIHAGRRDGSGGERRPEFPEFLFEIFGVGVGVPRRQFGAHHRERPLRALARLLEGALLDHFSKHGGSVKRYSKSDPDGTPRRHLGVLRARASSRRRRRDLPPALHAEIIPVGNIRLHLRRVHHQHTAATRVIALRLMTIRRRGSERGVDGRDERDVARVAVVSMSAPLCRADVRLPAALVARRREPVPRRV